MIKTLIKVAVVLVLLALIWRVLFGDDATADADAA